VLRRSAISNPVGGRAEAGGGGEGSRRPAIRKIVYRKDRETIEEDYFIPRVPRVIG